MRNLFKCFTLIAVATMGAMACQEVDNKMDITAMGGDGITINVSSLAPQTKIEFTDNDTSGIVLEWEVGDAFTVYDSEGEIVGDFVCSSQNEDETYAFMLSLLDGKSFDSGDYTAIYPASEELTLEAAQARDLTSTQNGDDISKLNAACYLLSDFTYSTSEANTIYFEHQKAIMTFKFTSDIAPSKLTFENGDDIYEVNYSADFTSESDIYTSHIMIEPSAEGERTLRFSLYADSSDTPYDIRETTSTKAYIAGVRYTASVSNLDPTIWLGSGTEADPYQITTADQLRLLSTNVNAGTSYSGDYFIMTGDIDLGGIDADGKGVAANEFTAIGYYSKDTSYNNTFQGTFDGAGHEVSGLYINQPDSIYQALFGYIYYATVKNLSVSGSVTGRGYVAGIVGSAYYGTTINCYNKATISGNYNYVAGVVAYNRYSPIINCYNAGSVSNNGEYGSTGGIVGYLNNSTSANNYNTGSIESLGDRVGGIVGYGGTEAYVVNSYNMASVSGTAYIGGIVGFSAGVTIKNSYFNSDNFSGAALGFTYDNNTSTLDNAVGFSTGAMKSTYFVDLLNNEAYNYNEADPTITACAWAAVSEGYPTFDMSNTPTITDFSTISSSTASGSGTKEDPYLIVSGAQLRDLATRVNSGTTYYGKSFEMMCDIDLGGISADGSGVEANEFTAIGNKSDSRPFEGTFDGCGHEVSGLYINKPDDNYQGLFGYAQYATIKNLGVDGSVSGSSYTGGIIGTSTSTTIFCCYNNATVSGYSYVGGVVGYINYSKVSYCYNQADVSASGSGSVGGVVGCSSSKGKNQVSNGQPYGSSQITSCYNRGDISGIWGYNNSLTNAGGVVGSASGTSIDHINYVANCYNTGSITGSPKGGILGSYSEYINLVFSYSCSDGICGSDGSLASDSSQFNNATSTSDEMKESSFVELLNSQFPGTWKEDTGNINDGYPILSWQ